MKVLAVTTATLILPSACSAFSSTLFQEVPTLQKTAPSKHDGVDIELPDFDELFDRIQRVSPLAKQAIASGGKQPPMQQLSSSAWQQLSTSFDEHSMGFETMDKTDSPDLPWRTVESNSRRVVHQIEKIDNFQGRNAPLLRFRSTLEGPCLGPLFARFIMDLDQREKWDAQIANVYEAYPINDLDSANIAMQFGKYGDCSRLGIGYCQTKANLGIAPREQLTLCGIQDFPNGASIIWGTEMEDWHNHLLPDGPRFPRAKSHIFSTTLVPTGDNTMDVEYVLQLESGGNLPVWLTTPVIIDSVKKLFGTARGCFRGEGNILADYLEEQKEQEKHFYNNPSLLITP